MLRHQPFHRPPGPFCCGAVILPPRGAVGLTALLGVAGLAFGPKLTLAALALGLAALGVPAADHGVDLRLHHLGAADVSPHVHMTPSVSSSPDSFSSSALEVRTVW